MGIILARSVFSIVSNYISCYDNIIDNIIIFCVVIFGVYGEAANKEASILITNLYLTRCAGLLVVLKIQYEKMNLILLKAKYVY